MDWERIDHTVLQRTVSRIAGNCRGKKNPLLKLANVSVVQAVFLGLSPFVNKVLTLLSVNEINPFFYLFNKFSQYLRLHNV